MSESTEPWPSLNEPTLDPVPDTVVAPARPEYVEPPAAVGPPPPDRRLGAGMLLGILAVLIAAGGILLAWSLGHRNQTTEVTTVVTSSPTPTAGAVQVAVPRLIGLTERQALDRLTGAGFTSKVILEQSTGRSGMVVSQVPAGAIQVAKGTTVQILVSHAATGTTAATTASTPATTTTETTVPTTTAEAPPTPRTAQVPDVGGETEAGAAHALVEAGARPSFVFVPSDQTLGTVVGQAKQSGATVPYDAHIQVNLSQGLNMQTEVTVPSVSGKTLTDSVSTLNAAGLRLIYVKEPVSSRAQAGTVVQQSPGAGARIPRNAQVLVFVAAYTAGQAG